MTDFQAAILLAQLGRLDEQIARKTHNVARFERLVGDVAGLTPTPADPAIDPRNLFGLSVGVDTGEFGAVSTRRLVAALAAEGIPAFLPHDPVYLAPLWRSGRREARIGPDPDRALGLDARCPVAEAVTAGQGMVIAHEAFLGSEDDTDDLITALDKVRRLAADLPERIRDDRPI